MSFVFAFFVNLKCMYLQIWQNEDVREKVDVCDNNILHTLVMLGVQNTERAVKSRLENSRREGGIKIKECRSGQP